MAGAINRLGKKLRPVTLVALASVTGFNGSVNTSQVLLDNGQVAPEWLRFNALARLMS